MPSKIKIRLNERGLVFREGDFRGFLGPGTHDLPVGFWGQPTDKVEVVDAFKTRFEHAKLDLILRDARVHEHLEVADLKDGERALVWKDERIFDVLGPGRHAFWKGLAALNIEPFRVDMFHFVHPKVQAVLQHPRASQWLQAVQVERGRDVLIFRDGVLAAKLSSGLHVFWKGAGEMVPVSVDLREQVADVAGQEIITSDKVTIRVNLIVSYAVVNSVKAVTAVADHAQALYREAQLVLRAAVGTRTIDLLLADKEAVGAEVREALAKRSAELGIEVRGVGLRDIILPGDMKRLFNQVIAAAKEAEANLIRRREETAAARSQANTAKLLAESPQLARLKELELLKEVLAGAKATFVFGGGGIVDQVRGLVAEPKEDG